MDELKPTLWKTCRVLAHAGRLSCLREVLAQPGLNVGTLARRLKVSEHHASMMLRALQSRGLIRAIRQSRWAYYYPMPDPLVKSAAPILAALRKKLLMNRVDEFSIIRILTAFTHPRRLAILAYLHERGAQATPDICVPLGISQQALSRHLRKLIVRRFILYGEGRYCLRPTGDVLARTLLHELARP